jgi:hypothetical protein
MRLHTHCFVSGTLVVGGLLLGGCSRTGLLIDDVGRAPIACIEGEVQMTRAYPVVMFVLDRSTSMATSIGATRRTMTRWQALANALATTLPSIDNDVQTGALIFPSATSEQQSCAVNSSPDLIPKRGNVPRLVSLMELTSPGGNTPTTSAIDSAAKILLDIRASTDARAMVLATDGGPDCNQFLNSRTCRCAASQGNCSNASIRCLDDVRTVERIAKYAAEGLPTYVLGIQSEGDTEFGDVLDAMAIAGGRPEANAPQKYYAARSESELDAALTAIAKLVGACVYLTTSVPNAGGTIQLSLDGAVLSNDEWAWQRESNGEIVLRPDICQQVIGEEAPRLSALVSCADN